MSAPWVRSYDSAMRAILLSLTLAALAASPALAQSSRVQAERAQQGQLLDSMGGPYRGPVVDYVAQVGERVAAAAGKPYQCEFTVVDTPLVNAFTAPPGCYVYVTRGLLALMNSEAELAAVLGHEVGHVAADHARRQQTQSTVTGLAALLVGVATKSDLAGSLASRAAKLSTLGYSRSQEHEADTLALRYLPAAGYPATGLRDILDDLRRDDALAARLNGVDPERSVPGWARTHPLTSDRIQRVERATARVPAPGEGARNVEAYLAAIDGVAYGDDAKEGVVQGRAFMHPGLRVAFEAPAGFTLASRDAAIDIQGPDGLRAEFASGRTAGGRLDAYAERVMRAALGRTPARLARPQSTRINGVDAVILPAQAESRGQLLDVTVAAYAGEGGQAFHFVGVGPAGRTGGFDLLFDSFRRLTPREAAGPSGRRIEVVTVRPGDTVDSLAERMAFVDARLERFLMINALEAGQRLEPGRKVKLVSYSRR